MSVPPNNPTAPVDEPEGLDTESLDLGAFPLDSLMIRTEVRSAFEISRRIDSGQYIMDPDFQRDFVWEIERQSKLIESAVLRIPLPVFYLAETIDGKIVVVDGLQRLTTFHRYFKGQFALKGLGFAPELTGKKFDDLPPLLKNRLEDTPLTLYLIDAKVPEEAKYEIFERVNGGIPLTRQQMRNCLFVGEATRWLSRMAKDEEFLKTTQGGLSWRAMRDRECINRFAGFYLYGFESYDGSMDHFLNQTLRRMNSDLGSAKYREISERFQISMFVNRKLFGEHAFRKTLTAPENTWGRSVINVALFDIFSVLFAQFPEELVIAKGAQVTAVIRELFNNVNFNDAISRSTNSTRNVRFRFGYAREKLSSIIR